MAKGVYVMILKAVILVGLDGVIRTRGIKVWQRSPPLQGEICEYFYTPFLSINPIL